MPVYNYPQPQPEVAVSFGDSSVTVDCSAMAKFMPEIRYIDRYRDQPARDGLALVGGAVLITLAIVGICFFVSWAWTEAFCYGMKEYNARTKGGKRA